MRRLVTSQLIAKVLVSSGIAFAIGCSSGPGDDPQPADPRSDDVGAEPAPADRSPHRTTPDNGDGLSQDSPAPTMDPLPKPSSEAASVMNGESCEADADCASGHCTDGVCCDSACSGACESCNSAGLEGQCSPHSYGTDPENECGAPACFSGMQERFFCDGVGACQVESMECGLYVCGGHACYTDCRTDDECVESAWCNAGRCEAK